MLHSYSHLGWGATLELRQPRGGASALFASATSQELVVMQDESSDRTLNVTGRLLFRLKPGSCLVPGFAWIEHGRCYEGFWSEAMKIPRDVVIMHPEDPMIQESLSSTLFEQAAEGDCTGA
jgi:hypothetical protein